MPVKRVPLDFRWPLGVRWPGYKNVYYCHYRVRCPACEGSGYNPATKALEDAWYGHGAERWSDRLTQDEVDALVAAERLWDFTRTWVAGTGWVPKDPPYRPTAAEVNAWDRFGMGHDSLNCHICVRTRAQRLGVWGLCEVCDGEGDLWAGPGYKALSEAWVPEDPPAGEGWQFWERVSEGSPASPVFASVEELVAYLVEQGNDPAMVRQCVYGSDESKEAGHG